jgi:hypothetical protein
VRGILVIVIVVVAGILLVRHGSYGLTLFVVLPITTGAVGSWIFQASTPENAAATGALATTLASASLLLIGLEGVVCIAMALPLAVCLGALGGVLFYSARLDLLGGGGIAALFMISSATLAYDGTAKPPLFEVRSSIEINAPPAEVWKHVVEFSEPAEPQEWYFRAGIAYPKRARIEGVGPGAIRYCDFSTGSSVEPIEVGRTALAALSCDGESGTYARMESLFSSAAATFAWVPDLPPGAIPVRGIRQRQDSA